MTESKIVYKSGCKIRAIRGLIYNEDNQFIYLKRTDRKMRIDKSIILSIETFNDNGDSDGKFGY
ncbi:MAG: hypothetical protein ACFFG0_28825 [Candidatus Thorarchaeota archaeon]